MRAARALALAAAVGLGLGLAVPAAWAGPPTLVLSGLSTRDGLVQFTLTARDLPPGQILDPASVRVGTGATVLVSHAGAALTGAPPRAAMAVLDATARSGGDQLGTARAAIGALALSLPPDVRLGLVELTTTATAVIPPTTDRTSVTQALAGVTPAGAATLPAGVVAAAAALRSAGFTGGAERHIFVVGDGRDASAALTDAARTNLAADPIRVDVLAYGAAPAGQTRMQAYSTATGGQLTRAADRATAVVAAGGLAALFSPVLTVTATVPAELAATTGTLQVSVAGLTATTPITFGGLPAGGEESPPSGPTLLPAWFAYVFAVFVFVALVGAVLAVVWPRSLSHRRIKQIAHFGPGRVRRRTRVDGGSPAGTIARTALAASASVIRSGRMEERLALRLERAGMRLRPHEWLLLRVLIAAGTGIVASIVVGWVGILLGLAVGWLGTMAYQRLRIERRSSQFSDHLPDALQLIIGSLKSGFSLPQALDSLVRESPEPVGAEFGRALAEHRLGADVSDALERVAQRVGSEDLGWAVMAVRIQREVGGNLAEVLQTSVDTMRDRGRLRRHVRALSAEGRLSAWVLIALPLSLGLFMFVFRSSYMSPLVTDPAGITMLLGGGALFVVGIFWLTRVIRVEA